jgi:hypothetical protein
MPRTAAENGDAIVKTIFHENMATAASSAVGQVLLQPLRLGFLAAPVASDSCAARGTIDNAG